MNSLIMVVDVTESPKYPAKIFPKAQNFSQKRVKDNLKEWNSQSIQAILWLFTRPQLKYICLFINKVDLLVGYDEAMGYEIKEAYLPLMRELKEASDGVRFECLLGSAARDLKFGETCLRSVMSRAIFDAPMILPSAFLMGDTVSEISTKLPSLRWRTVS